MIGQKISQYLILEKLGDDFIDVEKKRLFPGCGALSRPLRDANVSLLRKKSEEGQIPSRPIFQQPANGWYSITGRRSVRQDQRFGDDVARG